MWRRRGALTRQIRSLNSQTSLYSHSHSLYLTHFRSFAIAQQQGKTEYASAEDLSLLRNIGISAHIDSGKTTTTERILFYTGRIKEIHEVRGKDGVGAKMDSMELEREKGITIKSAATHTQWALTDPQTAKEHAHREYHINIIDTPGHVDFTIEVERSLQVLDGAIMIVCASSGVQSQTITVDRQMRRYKVPRVCFLNKCDRIGATPFKIVEEIRSELELNAALVQIPIGIEENHQGVIDLVREQAIYFDGPSGEQIRYVKEIPDELKEDVQKYRLKLLERLGEVNEEMENYYLMEEFPSVDELKSAIRETTRANTFVPIFVGSAYKNKGVQPLLDGVIEYLPAPVDVKHHAFDLKKMTELTDQLTNSPEYLSMDRSEQIDAEVAVKESAKVPLVAGKKDPLLFLAFKLEENRYGQLTWVRVYQGTLRKGASICANNGTREYQGKKTRLARIVRLHSDELQDISVAQAGDICAMFGVDCPSGISFSDGTPFVKNLVISDLHVPDPVVSLSVKPKSKTDMDAFGKAFERFVREDPTFRVSIDDHTGACIFNGMGELHLQIYIERILREYGVETEVGRPRVNYKESITMRKEFDYIHKKQTGGRGQFARIIGYLEAIEGTPNSDKVFEFKNEVVGTGIPAQFIKSVEMGFEGMLEKGEMVGGPIVGLRAVLQDGVTHEVDSSALAFELAAKGCFRSLLPQLGARVSEPYMDIEINVPEKFQSGVVMDLSGRGIVVNGINYSGKNSVIKAYGPLDRMFGYATPLRSMTEGKGEFAMVYKDHQFVDMAAQEGLMDNYQEFLKEKDK